MLLFYIRHGDPIYNPDSLTEQGLKQAKALSKRLVKANIDKFYVSSSNRAYLTAKPTLDKLNASYTTLDWANENYTAQCFYFSNVEPHRWVFQDNDYRRLFNTEEVRLAGNKWYDLPCFSDKPEFKTGTVRVQKETYAFMDSFGYKYDEKNHCYNCEKENDIRIALFAHQGFGLSFLSALLDIPYPEFSTRFDFGHSSMTVIEFAGTGSIIPRILQFSNDSHIFADTELKTIYQNKIEF